MAVAVDFYKLPFSKAKPYLKRIYLSLDFIEDLELNAASLNIKAIYTSTSLAPIIFVDNKIQINKYLSWGDPESYQHKHLAAVPQANSLLIGYKHFDKWKFEDGTQIGDFSGQGSVKQELKLQRMIQRKVLGFWRYWTLRGMRQI